MLITFTIDPEIFLNPNDNLDWMIHHTNLLQLWSLMGVLVIPAEKETESKLLQILKNAPQKISSKWKHGLSNFRKISGNPKLAEALAADEPLKNYSICQGVRLALLDETRAELWGLSSEEYSKTVANKLEICRFGHQNETDVVKQVKSLCNRPIETNELPEVIWQQRFQDLVGYSKNISISDRYAIKNFLQNKGSDPCGLRFLLAKTASLPSKSKKIIHIFSAYSTDVGDIDSAMSFVKACDLIRAKLETFCAELIGNSLLELHLHVANDRDYGKISHYRGIRFDDKTFVTLDTGLEPLGGRAVLRTCLTQLINWSSNESEAYRKDEKQLTSIIKYTHTIKF